MKLYVVLYYISFLIFLEDTFVSAHSNAHVKFVLYVFMNEASWPFWRPVLLLVDPVPFNVSIDEIKTIAPHIV